MEVMESDPSPELVARVDALSSRVESMAARAERRLWTTLAVVGVVLLGMLGYLRYLHATIEQFADPPVLVELASSAVEPQLDAELNALGKNLTAQAPEAIAAVEKMVLDSPPQLVAEGRRMLVSTFDSQLAELEKQSHDSIQGMLSTAFQRAAEKGVDLNDPAQIDSLVDDAIPLVRRELTAKVRELYQEYTDGSASVGEFIDRLATASDLSTLEKQQREVLITGLALIQKLEADPSRRPLQGVLEGALPE
jgi:hypothetical protein